MKRISMPGGRDAATRVTRTRDGMA
jgi:hypothetical protein